MTALAEQVDATADDVIAGLQPAHLWGFFKDLTQIPRPSKHEERVLQYLKGFADARNLSWCQDTVGNLVIRRPGSGGGEAAPTVVIQGHIDMVCEKDPSLEHDFLTQPLRLQRSGDWVKARGTTLGADNGIGVAAALALLSSPPSAKLPPLECLFTVDEETGLTGARQISPDLVSGRTMLNLDSEDWGEVFIGCAGGGDMNLILEVALAPPPPGMRPHMLRLGGLLGGHSGLNIAEGRGNAVALLARCVSELGAAAGPDGWRLAGAGGGEKRNAIARDAWALLMIAEERCAAACAAAAVLQEQLRAEYGAVEAGLRLSFEPLAAAGDGAAEAGRDKAGEKGGGAAAEAAAEAAEAETAVIAPADAARLLALVRGLPHGPLRFSQAVAGLVETSNNVASLREVEPPAAAQAAQGAESPPPPALRRYSIVTTTRSSLNPALEATRDVIQGLASLAGCVEVVRGRAYPGWQPNLDSPVLQVTLDAYAEVLGQGRSAKVGAIHAGLECGILGERFPGMDMVSFGPTIKSAHSPDERVQISTVEPFWRLTLKVLERLADVRQ